MPAYPPALAAGLLPPFSTPGASTSALPPVAPAPSPAPSASRGLCFCGAAVDAADALADDASCVSDDDDEAAIYCSRACARADALHALLSGGSSSADMMPSLSSDSTSTVSTVGPRTPPRLASLPREPAAPRADMDARRASKARVLACASKQLQSQYPDLNIGLDSTGHMRLSSVAAEAPASDDDAMAASLSLRLGMLGGSHYRRIQALRPVFEFNDSDADGAESPSSSTSSGSYVAAPSHASPEREQARLAALNAPAQARARHARKDAMAAEALSSALSPPDSGFATALPSPATRASYLHHSHSRSDASSASDVSGSGNSLFSDDAGNLSCRSRATTMSTSERPPLVKGLFCTNPDRSSRSDLPIPPAPAPTSRELDLRAELAALDAELDSTFEAFEFWAEEHSHGDVEKWSSGLETDADGNLLGLALGAMGPLCSTPMPSCAQFASQSALFGGGFDDLPTTLPLQCRRPSLAPLDIDASLSVDRSVFEPDSPLLTPPSSSARGVTAAFSSFWRRTTTVSPPCTPEDGQPFDFTQRKPTSPPSPTGREREQAERLAGRIDAVLRSRWSNVKGAFAPSSPPAAEGKSSAGPSPTSRPSLAHKRSRALLAAIAA
jgi:hypothetical protein